jgi:TolB-like protein
LRVRLEEKPFQILELLLERPGHVVTRKTLSEKLWPDIHVGYEQSLNTAINKLRALLGDAPQSPRFIETLPRVGYRFIAPVDRPGRTQTYAAKKMLVVLPFENLNGDPEQEFFPDGLTEELISHLGQLNPKRLGVIARTSAIQYKGTKKTVREIASELSAEYILEGSVRRQGTSVRITAQLVDARDQTHLWAASYDRELRASWQSSTMSHVMSSRRWPWNSCPAKTRPRAPRTPPPTRPTCAADSFQASAAREP